MKLYLVAYYFQRPKHNRVRTNKAGWQNQPNAVSYDEQVAITKNLNNRDITMAKVILDMVNKKIVKNGWMSSADFDQMFAYYYGNYPQYTKEVMQQLDPSYLNKFGTAAQTPVKTIDTSGSISSV